MRYPLKVYLKVGLLALAGSIALGVQALWKRWFVPFQPWSVR